MTTSDNECPSLILHVWSLKSAACWLSSPEPSSFCVSLGPEAWVFHVGDKPFDFPVGWSWWAQSIRDVMGDGGEANEKKNIALLHD